MDLLNAIRQGGELVDKATGGRALRGLAAGRPRELASIVPFSDTMGWTDPTEAASGRDVTNKWGLTDPSSSSFGSAAAGFGADMLLSPLSLAGGVGAFRAAPTVGKGLAAAAKSLSGVDAIEGMARGAGKSAGALAEAVKSPGLGGLPSGLKAMTTLGGGALGAETGRELAPEHPWAGATAGTLLGALAGHGMASHPGAAKLATAEEGAFSPAAVAKAMRGQAYRSLPPAEFPAAQAKWLEQLSPEEHNAIKAFTGSPQEVISSGLRHPSKLSFQNVPSPAGMPQLATPRDIEREVLPYLSSALSRTESPENMLAYRVANQFGNLTAKNAEQMIGKIVTDPSPLSTSVTPWERFYGQSTNPNEVLADIAIPKGGRGGYISPLSRFPAERELLLPPSQQLAVRAVENVPSVKYNWDWYKMDPEGKPFPIQGHRASELFNNEAAQKWLADIASHGGHYGTEVVPHEVMAPDWQARLAKGGKSDIVKNVLFEAIQAGQPVPHQAAVGRMPAAQVWNTLSDRLKAAGAFVPNPTEYRTASSIRSLQNTLKRFSKSGEMPKHDLLAGIIGSAGLAEEEVPFIDLLQSSPQYARPIQSKPYQSSVQETLAKLLAKNKELLK